MKMPMIITRAPRMRPGVMCSFKKMAERKIVAPERFVGASTDTKSTDGSTSVRPGATWFEYDTGDMYITYDGTNWVVKDDSPSRIRTITGSLSGRGLGTYSANDVISDSTASGTAIAFAAIARANGQRGYITKAKISLGTSGITPRLDLLLFNTAPGSGLNDNVANILVGAAEQSTYQGRIEFVGLDNAGSGYSESIATPNTVGGVPLSFDCASGADDLYGVLVARTAYNPISAEEFTVRLKIMEDTSR